MRRTAPTIGVAIAASALGCTLLTSLDGLREEGASGVLDAATSSPSDGGAGDAPVADATPTPTAFCASLSPKPTLCADFDSNPFSAGWDKEEVYGQGRLSADDGASVSSPRSLRSVFLQGTTGGAANLERRLETALKSRLLVDFDVKVESYDDQRALLFVVELTAAGSRTDRLAFRVQRGVGADVHEAAELADGGIDYAATGAIPLPAGSFAHVTWEVKTATDGSSMSLDVDGTKRSTSGLRAHQYLSTPKVSVGIAYLGQADTDWRVRFDNVVIKVE